MRVLLVGGGPLSFGLLKSVLQEGFDLVYAVDGGARYLKEQKVAPHVLVGDFDSLDVSEVEELKEGGSAVRSFPVDKDWTDMELALDAAIHQGATSITILGGLGARMDHSLANIGLIYRAEQQGVEAVLRDEGQEIRLIGPGQTLELTAEGGTDFSLLPLGFEVGSVRVWGAKFPLDNGTLHFGETLGVHNKISARSAHIMGGDGYLILIRFKELNKVFKDVTDADATPID